ncbi:MAG: hypothetical protein RLZZ168_1791 [Cyanobacteriota bacterium]
MSSVEQAYAAVEQAYAAADFQTALERAEALLPQITDDRDDQLQQRLQLLIGHIHLYGLQQPPQAAAAYRAVLEQCQEPSYRAAAEAGLRDAAIDQPATPWLEELQPGSIKRPNAVMNLGAAPTQVAEAPQTKTPDPYDRGRLELQLAGRPSELGAP